MRSDVLMKEEVSHGIALAEITIHAQLKEASNAGKGQYRHSPAFFHTRGLTYCHLSLPQIKNVANISRTSKH